MCFKPLPACRHPPSPFLLLRIYLSKHPAAQPPELATPGWGRQLAAGPGPPVLLPRRFSAKQKLLSLWGLRQTGLVTQVSFSSLPAPEKGPPSALQSSGSWGASPLFTLLYSFPSSSHCLEAHHPVLGAQCKRCLSSTAPGSLPMSPWETAPGSRRVLALSGHLLQHVAV